MNSYTLKALDSWYYPDNSLYKATEPAVLGLTGECGEFINLVKKLRYKPGYQWDEYETRLYLLDELGDIWWYYRIVAWLYDYDLDELLIRMGHIQTGNTLVELAAMINQHSANILISSLRDVKPAWIDMVMPLACLIRILGLLDSNIDILTGINYQKLNSKGQNGWEKAR